LGDLEGSGRKLLGNLNWDWDTRRGEKISSSTKTAKPDLIRKASGLFGTERKKEISR